VGWGALLQDWITIKSAAAGSTFQSEPNWIFVGDFTDVGVHASIKGVSGANTTLHVQTSPSFDDELFRSIGNVRLSPTIERTFNVKYSLAATVPAQWLRWQLEYIGAMDATFRLWITLTRTAR
jgi:hypothetical protein